MATSLDLGFHSRSTELHGSKFSLTSWLQSSGPRMCGRGNPMHWNRMWTGIQQSQPPWQQCFHTSRNIQSNSGVSNLRHTYAPRQLWMWPNTSVILTSRHIVDKLDTACHHCLGFMIILPSAWFWSEPFLVEYSVATNFCSASKCS